MRRKSLIPSIGGRERTQVAFESIFPVFSGSQYGLHMVLYRNLRVQSCIVLLQKGVNLEKHHVCYFSLSVFLQVMDTVY